MPLAFLFFLPNIYVRFASILLAMISDGVDGYFARKYKSATKFGAFFDPAMDKFFVYFVLVFFVIENKINLSYSLMMISRDFALVVFGLLLIIFKKWSSYEIKPVRWGKMTTALQFITLISLNFGYAFPVYFYFIFVAFAVFAFIEMIITAKFKHN